jgi:hypothetical protein
MSDMASRAGSQARIPGIIALGLVAAAIVWLVGHRQPAAGVERSPPGARPLSVTSCPYVGKPGKPGLAGFGMPFL